MFIKTVGLLRAMGVVPILALIKASPISNIIHKDVIVVGGGAAGAYAAVLLREDYNQSIALIEKEDILGGAVNTWTDPATGEPIELGVEAYLDYEGALDFFERFNVSVTRSPLETPPERYADFTTGRRVNFTAPTSAEQFAAFEKYVKLAEQYEDIMTPGLWNFPTGDDIPEDLLLNFGDFAKKHGIEAAVPKMWDIASVGLGDLKTQPTFYVIQSFPASQARVFIGIGQTVYVSSGRNQDIYDKVADLLGDDVLYSSRVISADRTSNSVKVTARGPNGALTEIHAKRLLIACPPTLDNLQPFNLDKKEFGTLSKTNYTRIYAGGVSTSNLPLNTSILDRTTSGDWVDYPDFPYAQWFKHINSSFPNNNYHKLMIYGDKSLDAYGAKALVEDTYQKLIESGTVPADNGTGLRWLDFAEAGNVNVRTSVEGLKAGWITEFYSLQGHLSTWYTGAAWSAQLHTPTWAFSATVVPRLVNSL